MDGNAPVAVLGTGIMGTGMIRRLLRAGLRVTVWNRTREKAEALAEDGAQVAATPREATRNARVVVTILSDGAAVEQAMLGGRGGLEGMAADAIWMQMSTVGPHDCTRFLGYASGAGVAFVDAPVLGTRKPAAEGQLVILAAGPRELLPSCRPVLDAIGRRTIWLDEPTMGTRLKLVCNNWVTGLTGVLAETLVLAERSGIDPARFLDAIEGGPLDVPFARVKGGMMIRRDYPTQFPLVHALKDARLIAAMGRETGLPMAMTEALVKHFEEAERGGRGAHDLAAVAEGLAARSGLA